MCMSMCMCMYMCMCMLPPPPLRLPHSAPVAAALIASAPVAAAAPILLLPSRLTALRPTPSSCCRAAPWSPAAQRDLPAWLLASPLFGDQSARHDPSPNPNPSPSPNPDPTPNPNSHRTRTSACELARARAGATWGDRVRGGRDLDGPLPLEEERVLLPQRANLQTRPRRGVAETLAVCHLRGEVAPRRQAASSARR